MVNDTVDVANVPEWLDLHDVFLCNGYLVVDAVPTGEVWRVRVNTEKGKKLSSLLEAGELLGTDEKHGDYHLHVTPVGSGRLRGRTRCAANTLKNQSPQSVCQDILSDDDDDDDNGGADDDQDELYLFVSDFPARTTKTDVFNFFQNKCKSGGSDIKLCEYDKSSKTAKIIYRDPDVLQRVFHRFPMLFKNKKISAKIVNMAKDAVVEGEEEEKDVDDNQTCTVLASGLTDTMTDDMICYYMENRRRSGGGEIRESCIDREAQTAHITFLSPEVAERVAKKKHSLNKQEVRVSLYFPPKPLPLNKKRILISGLCSITSEDSLINFLEAKTDFEVISVEYMNEDKSVVMIVFKEDVDFEKVKTVCEKKTLDHSYLKVSPIHISNCVCVENLSAGSTEDLIINYFENKRRSGGGVVEKIQMSEDGDSCLVYFTDPAVADTVCSKEHTLNKQSVKVRIYQKCFDTVCKSQWKTPKPFIFTVDSHHKLNFLKGSDIHLKALNEQMNMGHAKLEFHPDSNVSTVEVQCTLTLRTKDGKKLSKNWKDNAEELLKKYIDLIKQAEVKVLTDVWQQLKDKLKSFEQNKNQVNIIFDDDNTSAIVTGSEPGFSNVERKVKEISDAIVDEMNRRNQEITEKMDLPEYKLKLLIAKEFPNWLKMKFKDLKVTMDLKQHTISFCGNPNEVKDAQIELYKILNDCKQHTLEVPDSKLQLIDYKQVKVHIEDQFKAHSIVAAWNIIQGNLVIYGLLDKTLVDAVHMIETTLVEQEIPLSDESSKLLSSVKWQQLNESLLNKFNGQYFLRWSNNAVTITAIKTVIEIIAEDITNFFQDNTIYSHVFPLVYGYYQFLKCFKKNDIADIVEKQKHNSVTVDYGVNKITIQGTETGLKVVRSAINQMIKLIIVKNESFVRPGVKKFLSLPKGKELLRCVGMKMNCTIITNDGDNELAQDLSDILIEQETIFEHAYHGCILSVIKGDITQLKVGAIVNAANCRLDHVGGLAKVIVEKGGQVIQDECNNELRKRKQKELTEGQVVKTRAGNLCCSFIFHAVGPSWNGGSNYEEESLGEAVNNCMKLADEEKLSSIALPAISTGVFNYPPHLATKVIVREIKNYLENNLNSGIQQVIAVDIRDTIITSFCNAFASCFNVKRKQKAPIPKQRFRNAAAAPKTSEKTYEAASSFSQYDSRVQINVMAGELAKSKADVIVNTTGKNLKLNSGAVSSSILKTAGPGIQQECSQKYPNGIQQGIAITKGYNLPCKEVYHCSLPQWKSKTAVQMLQKIVKMCIDEANKSGYGSISFPALGAGNLGYPPNVVAKTMCDTVNDYYTLKNKTTTVGEVNFVVYHLDTNILQAFNNYHSKNTSSHEDTDNRANRIFEKAEDLETRSSGTNEDASFQIGSVTCSIIKGDITMEKVDVIVNPTNTDFSEGTVSKAIMSKLGNEFRSKLQSKDGEMRRENLVMTEAGNLPCEHILHVNAKQDLKEVFLTCFCKADKEKFRSLGLPLIGAGNQGLSTEASIRKFIDALATFAPKSKHLTDVRLTVFQEDMLLSLIEGAKKILSQQNHGSFFQRCVSSFKNFVGYKPDTVTSSQQMNMGVMLVFYSDKEDNIQRAIKNINHNYEQEIEEMKIERDVIKELPEIKIKKIEMLGNTYDANINIQRGRGLITFVAAKTDCMKIMEEITGIFIEAIENKRERTEAEMMKQLVQWYYFDGKGQLIEYPRDINFQIETAYQRKDNEIVIASVSGEKFLVVFSEMKEYCETDKTDFVVVLRKDIIKDAHGELPANWDAMIDTDHCKSIQLLPSTQEYKQVYDAFMLSMNKAVNSVIRIDRIQNVMLYQQYLAKKVQLNKQNPKGTQNEKVLWHGTTVETVPSINLHGFNRSYCGKNAVAYGNGVYFAVNASYSASNNYARPDQNGSKHIYQCKVLVGESTVGAGGLRVPPIKSGPILYDSVVDNISNASIYVVFNDTQAYPEYLIVFN